MQCAHRRVRIPGAFGAVFLEHFGQGVGVFGQALQGHGAVFDEAHRFAIALQAHHDVQASFTHFPQVFLRCIVDHLHHAAGQAQVTHEFHQLAHLGFQTVFVCSGKLHQQHRLRLANQCRANGGRKGWVLQRQIDHGAVHQLHRRQGAVAQLHDVLRCIHGLVKAGKVHHPQHLGAGQLTQAQGQRLGHRQRALAADQQVRQVHRAVRGVRALVLVAKNV